MRLRVLAAAAVAAWSKTAAATTASVLPGVLDQPAEASVSSSAPATVSCSGPEWFYPVVPNVGPNGGEVEVGYKSISAGCVPGTASTQASVDQTHWKTLTSQHETTTAGLQFWYTPRLPGSWWYRGFYVTDDDTFKGSSLQAQFTR